MANADCSVQDQLLQDRERFLVKWENTLALHLPPGAASIERAARRLHGAHTVLVADEFIPFDDRSAGGRRLAAILKMMRELDCCVIFISSDGRDYEPFASRLRSRGIEVRPHRHGIAQAIEALPQQPDVAWLCRHQLFEVCAPMIRARTDVALVYDTVDLHYLRLLRGLEATGDGEPWEAVRMLELEQARAANVVVTTSSSDQAELRSQGVESCVIPVIEDLPVARRQSATRDAILFLGNYSHKPNVDAAVILAQRIMPIVWREIPDVTLVLAGDEPVKSVRKLANRRVEVTGFIADLAPVFERAHAFVAPLRFGAGMKGKVVQSLAYGVPVVTTEIGAEGIGIQDGINGIIASSDEEFAAAITFLVRDPQARNEIAGAGRALAQRFTSEAVRPLVADVLEKALRSVAAS